MKPFKTISDMVNNSPSLLIDRELQVEAIEKLINPPLTTAQVDAMENITSYDIDINPLSYWTQEKAMQLTIIESPYAGNAEHSVNENVSYAQACMKDVLDRGDAPMVSHLLNTQAYDDADHAERQAGMEAGWAWMRGADVMAIYTDLGVSPGMEKGIERASKIGLQIEFRQLGEWDADITLHFDMEEYLADYVEDTTVIKKNWLYNADLTSHGFDDDGIYYATFRFHPDDRDKGPPQHTYVPAPPYSSRRRSQL